MPEIRPIRPVNLVDPELGVIDRVEEALLLEHEAAVILVHGRVRGGRVPALRGLARDRGGGVEDPVAGVDLERGLVG